MFNPEMGPQEPEEEIPQQKQPEKSESGAELDLESMDGPNPLDSRQETRMDVLKGEIEQKYQERLSKLEEYQDMIGREFNLKPEDFNSELARGESPDKELDELLQAVYKKREEIEQDKKDAIAGLRQRLGEDIGEI